MAKKIAISFSVVFAVALAGLTFFLIASEYSASAADTSAQLEWADEIYQDVAKRRYRQKSHYDQAAEIYQDIVTEHPGTDHAFQAQMKLTVLHIARNRWAQAKASLQKLAADFSNNEQLTKAVHGIAQQCLFLEQYGNGIEVYQYLLDHWPNDEYAMWSYSGIANANISLGNEAAVQAAMGELLDKFSEDEYISAVFYDIADQYYWFGEHEKALQTQQYALDNWPEAESAIYLPGQ